VPAATAALPAWDLEVEVSVVAVVAEVAVAGADDKRRLQK